MLRYIVLFCLLFTFSCNVPSRTISNDIMDRFSMELEDDGDVQYKDIPQSESGWVNQDEDGYVWDYHAKIDDTTIVLATCRYTYIKYNGIEKWIGYYYGKYTEWFEDDPYMQETDGLCGCVAWVNHNMIGDYYF